jgi:hypothetical protein
LARVNRQREEPDVQWKAAAFVRWHEPDKSRGLGGCDGKIVNCLPTLPGWNYMVRTGQRLNRCRDFSVCRRRVAEDTIADVEASGLWPGKVVTKLSPAGDFWEAEPEHQDYLERYPNGYTRHFVRPQWKSRQQFLSSCSNSCQALVREASHIIADQADRARIRRLRSAKEV